MTLKDLAAARVALYRFFRSRTFEFGIVAVICVNAVLLAAETVP